VRTNLILATEGISPKAVVIVEGEGGMDPMLVQEYEVALSAKNAEEFVQNVVAKTLADEPINMAQNVPLGITSAIVALLLRGFIRRVYRWVRRKYSSDQQGI
jgi:hypothetical protein